MYLAKSIDELYEEVKKYDLVMCNDAPLASALNNRVDEPRVGVFAITPRQLAGDLAIDTLKKLTVSDIHIVRTLAKRYNYPLRYVHGEIENFKTIRRYTREVRNFLKGNKSKMLYEDYVICPTIERAMEEFNGSENEFFKGKKIAVIGGELYDELDKNLNPAPGTFEPIELFKNDWDRDAYKIEHIRVLYNDHQIAENAVDMIDENNACDVAIVMDVGGKIADAVRSELYRRGLPFINEMSIRDLSNIRDYIEFLNKSLNFKTLRVSQVRELLQTYGGSIHPKYDEYLVENFSELNVDEKTTTLLEKMRDIRTMTYGDVCSYIPAKDRAQVTLLLEQLELKKEKVDDQKTADMIYSINNFELKHNEQIPNTEKEGVLLVDCKNSAYIDRPIVIYLGMGQEWERDLSDLNLIDHKLKGDIIDRNLIKFQILLQQGTSRIYICNSVKNGKDAKPCSYFEIVNGLRDKKYDEDEIDEKKVVYRNFSDMVEDCIYGPWYDYKTKTVEKVGVAKILDDKDDFQFSQSTFNKFITCPKGFMYARLIKAPDNSNIAMGSYLHQYAEFRSCFPELADEYGHEYFVKEINGKCIPLFSPELRKVRESKLRSAVGELDDLVEALQLDEGINIIDKESSHENMFFHLAGMEGKGSDTNEVVLMDRDRHMNGTLDVIKDDMVLDFKTGGAKDPSNVRDNMLLDTKSDYGKDFQCLFYLSLMMNEGIDKPSFSFFSTSANEINDTLGYRRNLNSAIVTVKVVEDKRECIREALRYRVDECLQTKNGNRFVPFIDNYDGFIDHVFEKGLLEEYPDISEEKLNKVLTFMGLDIYGYNRDNVMTLLKTMNEIVRKKYWVAENNIFITKAEMEEFRELVQRSYRSVKEMNDKEFPVDPKMDCKHCGYRDMCIKNVG